ncbi:MAG: hypothetical protein ACK5P5_09940 [Pseudobdellovibrionaceae bacterium]
MKNLILVVCLFLSTLSFAKTKGFEVQINEVTVNGSVDAQPRKFKVNPNQPVVISRSFDSFGVNTIVEMKVTDDDSKIKDGILIALSISEVKNGDKKIVGTPQIIVRSGLEAQITQGKEGKELFIKASLVGTRVQ